MSTVRIERLKKKAEWIYDLDLSNSSRKHEFLAPKAAFAAAAHHAINENYSAIGRVLEIDRTTVYHHVKNHEVNYDMPHQYCVDYTRWYDIFCELMRSNEVSFESAVHSSMLIGFLPDSNKAFNRLAK